MRHKKKRVMQLDTGVQKRSNVVRNLLTSLVTHGQIVTTTKRAKAIKAEADQFFGSLVKCYSKYDDAGARREIIRKIKPVIYTDDAGKKLVNDLVPQWNDNNQKFGYVSTLKL
jgi:ribosomal protein L17